MSNSSLNLALRFVLEIAALAALAWWGWSQHEGVWRWALAIGLPLLAAVVWAVFRVPGDPGEAPVAVPGPVRLLIEAGMFGLTFGLLAEAGQTTLAIILFAVAVVHYLLSAERVIRLMHM